MFLRSNVFYQDTFSSFSFFRRIVTKFYQSDDTRYLVRDSHQGNWSRCSIPTSGYEISYITGSLQPRSKLFKRVRRFIYAPFLRESRFNARPFQVYLEPLSITIMMLNESCGTSDEFTQWKHHYRIYWP